MRQIDTDTSWFSLVTAAVPPVTWPVATTSPVFGTVLHFVPDSAVFVITNLVVFLLEAHVSVPPLANASPLGAEALA